MVRTPQFQLILLSSKELLIGDEMLIMSTQDAAQYIAKKLNDKGNAFEGLINLGGDTTTAVETLGRALPIKLSSFSAT